MGIGARGAATGHRWIRTPREVNQRGQALRDRVSLTIHQQNTARPAASAPPAVIKLLGPFHRLVVSRHPQMPPGVQPTRLRCPQGGYRQPATSITMRQWSLEPHSLTKFNARVVTLSWNP